MRYRLIILAAVASAFVAAARLVAGDILGALGWIVAAGALHTLSTKEDRHAGR